ncbi:MAG: hypothetical protein J5528_03505 [Firmicutes bacterium]|nr:hypothetical protein [Bacillota bacterium]
MKKIVSIVLALVLALSLSSAVAFADVVKPTSTTPLGSLTGISSVVIEDTTASYWRDSNTGLGTKYIRAELPSSSKTEYDLRHATVVITTTGAVPSITGYTGSLTGTNEYTFSGVDLFNNAYTVTVSSNSYTLAAGLADGQVGISSSDPLLLNGTMESTTLNFYGSCQNNPYMGNPYYSSGWTFISYFFSATLPTGTSLSSVSGSFTLPSGASLSGAGQTSYTSGTANWNFSSNNAVTLTNGSDTRVYTPKLAVTGQTVLVKKSNYDINLTELKNSSYYQDSTIKAKADAIETAWTAYISQEHTFNSGSSVMDIMEAFITWASTTTNTATGTYYFTGTSNTSGGTYLSCLNGLDASDCGYMAGYMYADDPNGYYWTSTSNHSSMATVGANDYTFTNSTVIVWFYTVDFMNWFNW